MTAKKGRKPSRRVVYRVTPILAWKLTRNGRERAFDRHKGNIVSLGRFSAREEYKGLKRDTQLVVHGKNGRIQGESSFGHDPSPPKG